MNDYFKRDLFSEDADRIRGMVHRPDHITSILSAAETEKIRLKLQARIIEELREQGPMTDEELSSRPQFSHYAHATVPKRRTELYQKGMVICIGDKINSHGARMKIWGLP